MKLFQNIVTLSALLAMAAGAAFAADAPASANLYDIKKIEKVVKHIAYVDKGWRSDFPCVQAEIRVSRELTDEKPFARAYFYNRENKLVNQFDRPVQASDDRKDYTALPGFFKAREVYKVCFPITEKITKPGEKWARVVVVFGDANAVTAESFPKDDLAKFEFPEKELALKSVAKPGSASGLGR